MEDEAEGDGELASAEFEPDQGEEERGGASLGSYGDEDFEQESDWGGSAKSGANRPKPVARPRSGRKSGASASPRMRAARYRGGTKQVSPIRRPY